MLLCDEPTGNLDASIADSVADLLLDLHRAHNTILIVATQAEYQPMRTWSAAVSPVAEANWRK